MNGHDTPSTSVRGIFEHMRWAAVFALTAGVWAAGCREHRIDLTEFMAIQEGEAVEEPVAATQPALTDEELRMLDRELGPYRVGPGDVLSVAVIAPDVDSGAGVPQVRVDKKGEIRLPRVGALKVGGLELEDVETRILDVLIEREVYVERDQVVVNVQVLSPETTNVLVLGSAAAPGLVRLRRTERNLLNAVVAAGGLNQGASGEVTLKRLRQPGEYVTLSLTDPLQLKDSLALAPLENGDIIEVLAATPNTIYVGGLVNSPGPQPHPPGTSVTLLQAIAGANGLRTDITPREATLIRRIHGRDYHVKLDMDRISTARDPNITLAAGDILWIPYSVETRVQEWINRNIFIRAGATATYGLNYNMPGIDYLNNAAFQNSNAGRTQGNLQDSFDPFGFLQRNQALQTLQNLP